MENREIATLGGGCFWCLEAIYKELVGVVSAQSGYMGGQVENPSYEEVCDGETGHVEVVQVTFDPAVRSYREILEVFFGIHDPTTPDRQGNDSGTQYRSAIFYHDDRQRAVAEELVAELTKEGVWPDPIVTEVIPASTFYPAEAYHQDYFQNNPRLPYCAYIVAPKVQKFRRKFAAKART